MQSITLRTLILSVLTLLMHAIPCTAMQEQKSSSNNVTIINKITDLIRQKKLTDALCEAVKWGTIDDIKNIIVTCAPAINKKNIHDQTALHYAMYRPDPKITQLLLRKGAKTDIRNGREQLPIHIAVDAANHEVFKYLVRYPDIYAEDAQNNTPYSLAILRKSTYFTYYLEFADGIYQIMHGTSNVDTFAKKYLVLDTKNLSDGSSTAPSICKHNFCCATGIARVSHDTPTRYELYQWALEQYKKEKVSPKEYSLFDSLPLHVSLFLWNAKERLVQLKEFAEKNPDKKVKRTIEKLVKHYPTALSSEERSFLGKTYESIFKTIHKCGSIQTTLPTVKEYATLCELNL